jgi:hypothetical protein
MKRLLLPLLLGALFVPSTARAQDDDLIAMRPATPAECQFGGIVVIIFDQSAPVCNGAPGAPGQPGAQGVPGVQGQAGVPGQPGAPAQVLIQDSQNPACFSRRTVWATLDGTFRPGQRVLLRIGNDRWPRLVPVATDADGGRGRVKITLAGRPCGIYLATAWRPKRGPGHHRKMKYIYTAGVGSAWLTGINLR